MNIRIPAILICFQMMSCFGQESSELERVKQKYHAVEADPVIRQLAEEVLHK